MNRMDFHLEAEQMNLLARKEYLTYILNAKKTIDRRIPTSTNASRVGLPSRPMSARDLMSSQRIDSALALKGCMAVGKVRHVLTYVDGRMKHIPDIAAGESGNFVLSRCAFASAPLF
jgi:hypothetical protein